MAQLADFPGVSANPAPGERRAAGRARAWLGAGLIGAAATAAYAGGFSGPFQFDDIPAILDNPTLRRLWPLRIPLSPPAGALTVSGRPLLNLSFALNYAISGYGVWSYHALNLLIHVLAALTLFGIVRRTLERVGTGGPPVRTRPETRSERTDGRAARPYLLALGVALLWVLHPLQTESVTYVVQRAESLMGLCYLLTLYAFIRGIEGGSRGEPESGVHPTFWFGLSWLACLGGMATKEVMVTAPVVVFLYDRVFVAGTWTGPWRARKGFYLGLAATWVPLLGLVAGTGWDRGSTSGFHVGVSWVGYWLSQGEAVVRYVGLALWPHPLVFDYGPSAAPLEATVALAVLVFAAFVATAIGAWRGRSWAFPAAAFFLILSPTSVMPGVLQYVAEHRMYLPLAALLTLGVLGLETAAGWLLAAGARTAALAGLILFLAVGLGAATARRNRIYQSDLALWTDTIAKRPQSALAQANLGVALLNRGRTAEAIGYCLRALSLDPLKPLPHYNLGLAYEQEGRRDEALREFTLAAWINPKLFYAEFRAGRLLNRAGRPAEAERLLRQALANEPNFAEARGSLGVALAALGRPAEAAGEFQRALQLDPDQPGMRLNLGISLAQLRRYPEALAALQAAARLTPDSPDAHGNLAAVLGELGRADEAVAEYRRALQLRPAYPEAHYNLGNALLRAHDLPGALAEFRAALRLKPDFPAARTMLDRLEPFESGR